MERKTNTLSKRILSMMLATLMILGLFVSTGMMSVAADDAAPRTIKWTDGFGFHCNQAGGNGATAVIWNEKTYEKGDQKKVFGTDKFPITLERIDATTAWKLKTEEIKCNTCNSTEWVTYSNKNGKITGSNIQAHHPAKDTTKILFDIEKIWLDEDGKTISDEDTINKYNKLLFFTPEEYDLGLNGNCIEGIDELQINEIVPDGWELVGCEVDGKNTNVVRDGDTITFTNQKSKKLEITKEADQSKITSGATVTYTITVTNPSGKIVNNVIVTDPMFGIDNEEAKFNANSLKLNNEPVSLNENRLTIPSIEAGEDAVITYGVTFTNNSKVETPFTKDLTDKHYNIATLSYELETGIESEEVEVTVDPKLEPNISLTKQVWDRKKNEWVSETTIKSGQIVTFKIEIKNEGNGKGKVTLEDSFEGENIYWVGAVSTKYGALSRNAQLTAQLHKNQTFTVYGEETIVIICVSGVLKNEWNPLADGASAEEIEAAKAAYEQALAALEGDINAGGETIGAEAEYAEAEAALKAAQDAYNEALRAITELETDKQAAQDEIDELQSQLDAANLDLSAADPEDAELTARLTDIVLGLENELSTAQEKLTALESSDIETMSGELEGLQQAIETALNAKLLAEETLNAAKTEVEYTLSIWQALENLQEEKSLEDGEEAYPDRKVTNTASLLGTDEEKSADVIIEAAPNTTVIVDKYVIDENGEEANYASFDNTTEAVTFKIAVKNIGNVKVYGLSLKDVYMSEELADKYNNFDLEAGEILTIEYDIEVNSLYGEVNVYDNEVILTNGKDESKSNAVAVIDPKEKTIIDITKEVRAAGADNEWQKYASIGEDESVEFRITVTSSKELNGEEIVTFEDLFNGPGSDLPNYSFTLENFAGNTVTVTDPETEVTQTQYVYVWTSEPVVLDEPGEYTNTVWLYHHGTENEVEFIKDKDSAFITVTPKYYTVTVNYYTTAYVTLRDSRSLPNLFRKGEAYDANTLFAESIGAYNYVRTERASISGNIPKPGANVIIDLIYNTPSDPPTTQPTTTASTTPEDTTPENTTTTAGGVSYDTPARPQQSTYAYTVVTPTAANNPSVVVEPEPTVSEPEAVEPEEEIPDDETPQSEPELPVDNTASAETEAVKVMAEILEEIEDEDIPMDAPDLPKTGGLSGILTALAGLGLLGAGTALNKKKKDENDQ